MATSTYPEPVAIPNKENIRKWVDALRSGDYAQVRDVLIDADAGDILGYCCLGVACDVYRKETGKGEWDTIPVAGDRGGTFLDESLHPDENIKVPADGELHPRVTEWLGLDLEDPLITIYDEGKEKEVRAIFANDKLGYDFDAIADAIERTYLTGIKS